MTAPELRIGSLCSGYGGLDMAVTEVLGGSVAWHCQYDPEDKHQYAARILDHHWPDVPNHGDITAVDWTAVEPVDILTAGFPCQDLSYAGRGAGIQGDIVIPAGQMGCGCQWGDHDIRTCDAASPSGLVPSRLEAEEAAQAVAELNRRDRESPAPPPPEHIIKGNRSGLWYSVADAIRTLRPRLVVLENVRAIVARRPGLDVVLASLAFLGFDAEWRCVRASDRGAPHLRERWFCAAWPADSAGPGLEGARLGGRPASGGGTAAYADDQREHGRGRPGGQPQRHAAGPDRDAADAHSNPPGHHRELPARRHPVQQRVRDDVAGRRSTAADSAGLASGEPADQAVSDAEGREARLVPGCGDERAEPGVPSVARGVAPNAPRDGRDERGTEPTRLLGGSDAALGGIPPTANAHSGRLGAEEQYVRAGESHAEWGPYGPAVARWERALGRPAPSPVDDRGRLDPRFVEWMMGLPEGHVCDVPAPDGMTAAGLRNARLKALGNGVVRQQAAYALRLLLDRMGREVAA